MRMSAVARGQFQLQGLERLVVRQKSDGTFLGEKPVTRADAGMIQEAGVHLHFADREFHPLEFLDLDRARQVFPAHGKKRHFHLGGENGGEAGARTFESQNAERVLGFVSGKKKRESLDVVPMGVGQEQGEIDRRAVEFLLERKPKLANARARIENNDFAIGAHFDASRVAAVADRRRAGHGDGAADAPKLQARGGRLKLERA